MFKKNFWLVSLILITPLALALFINTLPEGTYVYSGYHFWNVLGSACIAGAVGYFTYQEYTKSRQLKVLLLAIGFVGTSILYGVHSLITPGHSLITISNPKDLINAFVFFGDASRLWLAIALTSQIFVHREMVLKRPFVLITVVTVSMVVVSSAILNDPSVLPNVKNSNGIDGNFTIVFKLVTVILLAMSAIRCFDGWRIISKSPLLAVSVGVFLLAETVMFFLVSKPWSLMWWLAHHTYLMAFLAVGYGLVLTDKTKRLEFIDASAQIEKHIKEIEQARCETVVLAKELKQQLDEAGRVQRGLMPRKINHELFSFEAVSVPVSFVSGDSYDYRWVEDNASFTGILLDVMGHGVSSALKTSAMLLMFQQEASRGLAPHQILSNMNNGYDIVFGDDGGFVAAICFNLNVETGRLLLSSAGIHDYEISLYNKRRHHKIPGALLGLFPNQKFELEEKIISEGTTIAFYTDGFADHEPFLSNDRPVDIEFFRTMSSMRDDATGICVTLKAISQVEWRTA